MITWYRRWGSTCIRTDPGPGSRPESHTGAEASVTSRAKTELKLVTSPLRSPLPAERMTSATPSSVHAPLKRPARSAEASGYSTSTRSRKTRDTTPVSPTLVKVRVFGPSWSADAGKVPSKRNGTMPSKRVSPRETPFMETLTWCSPDTPASEAPWRKTRTRAGRGEARSTPSRESETFFTIPLWAKSQSQRSGAWSSPDW